MGTPVKVALLVAAVIVVWWLAMSPVSKPQESAATGDNTAAPPPVPAPSAPPPASREQQPQTEQPKPTAAADTARAPTEAPAPAPATVPAVRVNVPMRQGPVDVLAQRFAGESRGSGSEQADARVRSAFTDPAIAPSLLHNVECRRSVCRTELRWSPQLDAAYVLGLTRAVGSFSAPVGIEGAGTPDSAGVRALVVYFGLTP